MPCIASRFRSPPKLTPSRMSAAASRIAGQVGQAATRAAGRAAEAGGSDKPAGVLQKGAKRDPELYVCQNQTSQEFT